jgi:PleD family two-component response regulator
MSRVLLIDSDPSSALLLETPLKEFNLSLQATSSGEEGLSAAWERTPTLILLALDLSDGDGLDVLKSLRARTRTAHIPVIILASRHYAARQNEVLQSGADDFVTKPFDIDIVGLRIRNNVQRSLREGFNHPQTGLPTGKLLQERIRELADDFGWYKIDLEIEHFGTFKEAYGFMTGQEVINFAAGVISDCVHEAGTPDDFIGQRSDTEYVVITSLERGAHLRDVLEARFNDGVQSFYNFMEREQGFIELDDGSGGRAQHPLMRARIKVQEGEEE